MTNFPRGSEWRQWDLHIHSPASFEWRGEKFSTSRTEQRDFELVDEMIAALNASSPAVFALMDYWCFDGWNLIKQRLAQADSPTLNKILFPGIELRLSAPMQGRLNAHVVFSDKIHDQDLRDFLSRLRLVNTDQPLSNDALRTYARQAGADKLQLHGFNKAQVDADPAIALQAGCVIAEVTAESYKTAINAVPNGMAIGFMPFDTNDGLASVSWQEHYGYVMSLFKSSPIFETRTEAIWNAFVGRSLPSNQAWIENFQSALNNTPRLPVSGSDAHQFVGVAGDNNRRGYGDFPSGRATWIKADPTWLGLLQAIKEPEKRCHIGALPPKLARVRDHQTFYIDRVELAKADGSQLAENWFDGTKLLLNSDLVAIIGNKGSGKSALADVIALLGNSQEKQHFSFLRKDRFRGKSGEPSRQFEGTLHWRAGEPTTANLADDPPVDRVELVKYIPQGRFEALCNDHASGKTDAFEKELRQVIFAHMPPEQRLGALSFDQLIEDQENGFRAKLGELRKNLSLLNQKIVGVEENLNPSLKSNLEEQLQLKKGQLAGLIKLKPDEVLEPPLEMSGDQKAATEELAALAIQDAARDEAYKTQIGIQSKAALQKQVAHSISEQVSLFSMQFDSLKAQIEPKLVQIGLTLPEVVSLQVNENPLQELKQAAEEQLKDVDRSLSANTAEKLGIETARAKAAERLNEPQKLRQSYLQDLQKWQEQVDAINGSSDTPDSILGLEARLLSLAQLPKQLEELQASRFDDVTKIYQVLEEQRSQRASLFAPVQDLIAKNALIREEYKLQFQSNLVVYHEAVSENIFSIVKQNAGKLRGEDESRAEVKSQIEKFNFAEAEGVKSFIQSMTELLATSASQVQQLGTGISPILRKDRKSEELYDYIYGLEYIEPKYTLLFQETPIEQLSPGQRGALLLIFYLLVDKGRNPIILDQPEENLDNETIVSLLVPVINEAKRNRQIIMVTHNPNLAVVCDAEQIVAAKFERNNRSQITYQSGSIEETQSNSNVVTILEGTKIAFDNRGGKYF